MRRMGARWEGRLGRQASSRSWMDWVEDYNGPHDPTENMGFI